MAFFFTDFDAFVRLGVESLLNGLWQGAVLTALVWCLLRFIRGLNATTRYVIWGVTLLTVVSLPLLNGLRPIFTTHAPVHAESTDEATAAQARAAVREAATADEIGAATESLAFGAGTPIAPTQEAASARANGTPSATTWFSLRVSFGYWSVALLAAWSFVAGWRALRMLGSYRRLQALKRSCLPLAAKHESFLSGLVQAYNLKRPVKLLASPDVKTPMAVGLTSPAVIIPADLLEQLTETELTQVVLHELAHIRRWDDWTNFGQKLIEALFFFFPTVLFIRRRMNLEREVACDDWVVSMTGANRPYAACLTKLLELTVAPRRHALAPGALVGGNQISRRVELLLRKQRSISSRVSRPGLLIPLSALVISVAQFVQVAPVIAVVARPQSDATRADVPMSDAVRGGESGESGGAVLNAATPSADTPGSETTMAAADALGAGGARSSGAGAVPQLGDSGSRTDAVDKSEAAVRFTESGRDFLNASASGAHRGAPPSPAPASHASNAGGVEAAATNDRTPAAQERRAESKSLLEQVAGMTSNSEKAGLLIGLVESQPSVGKMPDGFFEVFASITSGGEQRRILTALLGKKLGRDVFIRTLAAVARINSDGEKATVLMQAAKVCPNDDAVLTAYLRAVGAINSSHEKERALSALLQRNNLSRSMLLRTLELAKNEIGSEHSRRIITARLEARLAQ